VRTIVSEQTSLSEKQLRERVIELVHHARKPLPENASNVDIEQCFGLQICEDDLPLDKDGAFLEIESKIIINRNVTSVERKKFTVYHELVHHLLRRDATLYSYLHDAYEDSVTFDKTIEIICNVGAAEFILPRDLVRDLINSVGFSLKLVPLLCQNGSVSGPAALIQLIQCAPNHCYGVVCELGLPPTSTYVNQQTFIPSVPANSLYILYAIGSSSAKYSISRFTPIPKDHILVRALSESDLIKGIDKIPFRSGTDWRVPIEAICFRGNVYGIFNVTSAPSRQQLKLF